MKRCNRCKQKLSKSEFYKDNQAGDSLQRKCKVCVKITVREWDKKNPDKKKAQRKRYDQDVMQNPERHQKRKEYKNLWNKLFDKRKRPYNPEYQHTYNTSDHGRKKKRIDTINRRARLRNAKGKFTTNDFDNIIVKQNNKCNICGKNFTDKLTATVDHIIPISKNGTNYKNNIQALCLSCNSSKGNRT